MIIEKVCILSVCYNAWVTKWLCCLGMYRSEMDTNVWCRGDCAGWGTYSTGGSLLFRARERTNYSATSFTVSIFLSVRNPFVMERIFS